jgi:hypothetical protein
MCHHILFLPCGKGMQELGLGITIFRELLIRLRPPWNGITGYAFDGRGSHVPWPAFEWHFWIKTARSSDKRLSLALRRK